MMGSDSMDINSIIFTNNLPKLDLHGIDSATATVYIKDFIIDNIKMKNQFIIIIHGRGTGIIRNTTHNILRKNKMVKDFKLCYPNFGSTLVELYIDKK